MITQDDFVLINFVGRIKSNNQIFDLTYKDIAEKEGLDTKNFNFSPVLVVPKANYVLKPISDSVIGKNIGDKYTLEVKAKDGFGEFNPKLLKTYSLHNFIENNINPTPGDMVMLDGKLATVLSVNSGRVFVSFNHPLAGKDLIYEIEIVNVLSDDSDKIKAIFRHYTDFDPSSVTIEEKNVKISYPADKEIKPYIVDNIISDINKYINKEYKVEIAKI